MDNKLKVFLENCDSYEESLIEEKLSKLLLDNHLLDFVKPGMKIGLKVNLVAAMKPEKEATTNPIIVKVLTKMLINLGAFVTIGDSPGGLFNEASLNNSYHVTKMTDALIDETKVKLNDNFNQDIIDVNGKVLKKMDITSWILEQDAIINMCKLKSHGMMGLSCAVKNLFGLIPGLLKPEYHYRFPKHEDFAGMLIDINEYVKCKLNLVDAVIGMEGNGPTMGKPRKIGLLMASTNPYALDYISSILIDMDYQTIPTVNESIKRELCSSNLSDYELNLDINPYIMKDFEKMQPGKDMAIRVTHGPIGELFSKFVGSIMKVKPNPIKSKCIGCKKCYNICPAKAITMKNNVPHINRNKCIRCFCCQEFCPVGAMVTKKRWIINVLTKKKDKKNEK